MPFNGSSSEEPSAGEGPPDPASSVTAVGVAVGLGLVLAPVLLATVLPTQDGPSHVYNAFLAHRLEAGDPLFAPFLELGPGLWPNRFSHYVLTTLGPWMGWEAAERVVASLAAGLPFLALAGWTRDRAGRVGLFVLAAGLWMAGSWFFWKGFYDFCVSLAPFLGVAAAAGRMGGAGEGRAAPGWRTHLALQAMLLLTLVAHLFTFGAALALAAFVLVVRALRGELPPRHLAALLPGGAALAALVASGTLGGGEMSWYPWQRVAVTLLDGSWAATLDGYSWSGRAVLLVFAAAPFARRALAGRSDGNGGDDGRGGDGGRGDRSGEDRGRAGRSGEDRGRRDRGFTPFETFALLALVASVLVPAQVGTGQYAQERLRLLALLLLAPSATALGVELGKRRILRLLAPIAALAVAVAFATRGLRILDTSRHIDADLRAMDRVLEEHGVEAGQWITATHWIPFGPYRRNAPYVHLHDRLAVERRLVVLDNYEARMPIFPVRWRATPHRPEFSRAVSQGQAVWVVEITDGNRPWENPLLVLHEAAHPLVSRSPRLRGGVGIDLGDYGITELHWAGESP